jgi:hypothetical protein
MAKMFDSEGNFIGICGGALVKPLTEEEIQWVKNATYEQWVEKHGEFSAAIAFSNVTYLYKRPYPTQGKND